MKAKLDKVRIVPLGGLGGIGRNMTVFEYGEDMIVVDCGIMFPSEGMHGIDFLIPDFAYVAKNRERLRGIIITHGHEDHIGGMPYLLQEANAPVYATRLTLGLIQKRLEEKPPKEAPSFVEMSPRDKVHIGAFVIEFIRVNHSIIDGVGLAITTPVGTIIHTGDFKVDLTSVEGEVTDMYRFAEYGENGVLLLMSDSTNAERDGFTRSERTLERKLMEILSRAKGRTIIATFASNLGRIQQVLNAAHKYNKKVLVSGTTMLKNIDIANSLGYLSFHDDLFEDIRNANSLPHKRQVVLCTGTQGEPMSALSRIANGTHKNLAAGEGDIVVITASVIPGNERMVYDVVNSLMRSGAEVYYEADADLHVSGHASREELKLMISLTKPKFFMPVHGEYRHLRAHARLAESLAIKPANIIIAENGAMLELSAKSFEKTGAIELRDVYLDGREIGDMGSSLIKERQAMAADGIIFITLFVSRGRLAAAPDIVSRGFTSQRLAEITAEISQDVETLCERYLDDGMKEADLSVALRKSVKNFIGKSLHKNPLIEVRVFGV